MGKVQKFFNDLKTVAFSGSYTDLTNQPQINSNTLSGNKTTSDLGINANNVMMSDGVTSVEEAVDDVAGKIEKIIVQSATEHVTGVSGNWVYMNVTFKSPFKKQPLVTVNQYDTGTGNSWYPPILKNITVNGFTAGWYSVTGTKEFIWQAIGVI